MTQRKQFQDLNLSNAFLFAAALQDPEICQLVLEIILGEKVKLRTVRPETSMLYSHDLRYVRLDIYADDELEIGYNLEMQNEKSGNLAKRSRFHQAEMDVNALRPGQGFEDLKPAYVIFICTFDPFGKGRYRYTFEERCLEEDFPLGDETKKIFLNTKGKNPNEVPEELIEFLDYVENSTEQLADKPREHNVRKLHEKIYFLKKSREWEARYVTLGEWLANEAHEEALELAKEMAQDMAQDMAQKIIQENKESYIRLIDCMVKDGRSSEIVQLATDEDFLEKMKNIYLKD